MKDEWYSDNKDLIKWGGIIHLCKLNGIKYVIQVAYFRESSWPSLQFDDEKVPIPNDVISHFRDIEAVRILGNNIGVNIKTVRDTFSQQNREAYSENICNLIEKQTQQQIVFLDPDIGLAMNRAKPEHVKPEEAYLVWQSLKRGDVLVLYQHSHHDKDWKYRCKEKLADACRIDFNSIREWAAPSLTTDVVFFYCEKCN